VKDKTKANAMVTFAAAPGCSTNIDDRVLVFKCAQRLESKLINESMLWQLAFVFLGVLEIG
jgi:hypothetical protein